MRKIQSLSLYKFLFLYKLFFNYFIDTFLTIQIDIFLTMCYHFSNDELYTASFVKGQVLL